MEVMRKCITPIIPIALIIPLSPTAQPYPTFFITEDTLHIILVLAVRRKKRKFVVVVIGDITPMYTHPI